MIVDTLKLGDHVQQRQPRNHIFKHQTLFPKLLNGGAEKCYGNAYFSFANVPFFIPWRIYAQSISAHFLELAHEARQMCRDSSYFNTYKFFYVKDNLDKCVPGSMYAIKWRFSADLSIINLCWQVRVLLLPRTWLVWACVCVCVPLRSLDAPSWTPFLSYSSSRYMVMRLDKHKKIIKPNKQ